jgi:beta-glucosidase
LSYTQFEYSDLSVSQRQAKRGESVDVSLKVKNAGKVAGDEVVQLYIRDVYASVPRPVKELKGYQRVTLNPNEARTITFHLPVNQIAFYNEELDLTIEAGVIQIMLGKSSDDICLRGEFEINSTALVKDRVFACPVTVK